jgi:alpha-ribazole phosphatase
MMRVSLLRHGMTQGGDIYRGHTDVALTDEGLQQMHKASLGFAVPVDYLVSSDLQRCAAFSAMHEQSELLDARLQEMSFGDWDGQLRSEVWRTHAEQVKAFWDNPMQASAPNGESVTQVQSRAMASLHEHLQQALARDCKHLLMVTHGGVIRAMLSVLLQMQPRALFNLEVPYGGVVCLKVASFLDESGQPDYHISLDFAAKQDFVQ